MKSKKNQRLLALILSMVLMLSASISAMAEGDVQTEASGTEVTQNQAEEQSLEEETVPETEVTTEEAGIDTQSAEISEEPVQETTEQETAVTSGEATEPVQEATGESTETEVPTTEETTGEETQSVEGQPEETTTAEEQPEPEEIEWSQQVGDSLVKVIASKGVLPEEAVLSVNEITAQDAMDEIENAVEKKAIEEKFAIENIFAYDIKFMVGDIEVQPESTVQVIVDTPEITNGQEASVLHVQDSNTIEDMNGTVDEAGQVVFDTSHFSTYVIIQEGDKEVNVTIQHINKETNEKIYSDDEVLLPVGGKIDGYAKATNWNVDSVKVNDRLYESENEFSEIKVTSDSTIIIYYTPKQEPSVSGAVKFYDYTVKAGIDEGYYPWQNDTYYSFNMLGDGQKLTAGESGQNYDRYQYNVIVNGKNANEWTGGDSVVQGLLKGLDEEGNVVFNYPEPGFFVDSDATITYDRQTRYLRRIYNDYTLEFKQIGDSYTLKSVKDSADQITTNAGADFFPLDGVRVDYEEANTTKADSSLGDDYDKYIEHNYYFGMRYDVTFKIGDYIGPLNYSFTGDDDLWVVLDGDEVVIDLGGIHNAATKSVDLWNYIGNPETLTEDEKQQEHTLTVLYMERGAGESNCSMNFTLPSARISEVTNVPMADLLLTKVNKKGEGLEGARFELVNQATGETQSSTSTSNGTVQFTKLRVGTYTLKENVAPNGYMPSLSNWIVKVELDENGAAVATMYLSDGTTEYTNKKGSYYQILNLTEEEQVDSAMDYDKTVKLDDWNERTYDITISASSKLTSTTTEEKDAISNTMLVLDTSGSMLYEHTNMGDTTYNDEYGFARIGKYVDVKQELDTTKVYYFSGDKTKVEYKEGGYTWSYTNAKQPMIYQDGAWIYYNGNSWQTINKSSNTYVYTIDSSLTGLKEAAIAFTSAIGEASPESKIGIATFNSRGDLREELTSLTETEDLVRSIGSIYASAGTRPSLGLELAREELSENRDPEKKDVKEYVILFTDGDPDDGWSTAAETAADSLKQEGVVIYTVGLNLSNARKEWLRDEIASEGCALTAENTDELKEIFKKIQDTITSNPEIKNAEIKDVIDPRFVILDENGEPITKDYPGIENGITLENGGTVYYDTTTGHQYIVWTEQTIPNSAKGEEWRQSFKVQAKEDYIGGNNVTTNIEPDSKISTGYGDAVLPQPPVNVKADLEVGNKEVTIYKGDSVPTEEAIKNVFFDSANINTEYEGVEENDFAFNWYSDENLTQEITGGFEALNSQKPESDTKYYLKVTYNAGSSSDKSEENTTKDGKTYIAGYDDGIEDTLVQAVNKTDSSKLYGIYTVHVISGEIQITKKIETTGNDPEQSFTFNIKKDGEDFKNITITVPQGETEVTYSGDELKGLSRGEYEITESTANGYDIKEWDVGDDTDCENLLSRDNSKITFTMGKDVHGNNVISSDYTYTKDGVKGIVTCINEKVIDDWGILKVSANDSSLKLQGAVFELKKGDILAYTGESDENGKIIWKENGQDIEKLQEGTYILTEKTAPQGYMRSEEEWTININKDGKLKSITSNSGESIESTGPTADDSTVYYYYKDKTFYSLPSSGGPGIFLYMIGGTLLLMAGSLMIYINRRKGVLRK